MLQRQALHDLAALKGQAAKLNCHSTMHTHIVQLCIIHSAYACRRCLAISNQVCTIWPQGSILKGALDYATNRAKLTDDMSLHQAGTSQSRDSLNVLWHAEYLKTPVALLVFKSKSPTEPKPPSPERAGAGSVPSTLLMTAMPDPSTASKEGMPPV